MLPQRRLLRDLLVAVLLSALLTPRSVLGTALDDAQSLHSNEVADEEAYRKKNEMLNYTFFDHSRKPDSYEIAVQGVFRYYHAVEDAIEKINRKHADWCGFGIKLKEDGIDEAWESTERDEFEKMFIEYNCYERKKKGFYAKPGEETEEEKRASTNTAIIVIIVLACFIGVAIVVLITLVLCKFCGKESENDVEAGLERSKKKRGGQATRSSKKSSRRSVLENTERTTSGSALKEDNKSGSEESSRL